MGNPIFGLRIAEDYANAVDCVLGECPYQVFLTQAVNASIDIDTIGNSVPVPTYTRITIADGYRAFLAQTPSDGYLYPMVIEKSASTLVASGDSFTSSDIVLGPLVLPYIWGNKSGGIDPGYFSPPINSTNLQYWIKLVGPGVLGGNGKGAYFDIVDIHLDYMNNINYYLILRATATIPSGTI